MGGANVLSAPSNLSGRRINDRGPPMPVSLRLRKTVGYTDNQRAIGGAGAIADVRVPAVLLPLGVYWNVVVAS